MGSYHFNLSLRIEDNNVKAINKLTEKNKNLKPKIKENLKKGTLYLFISI